MPKILHTYRYTGQPWEILRSVVPDGYEIKTLDPPTYEQLVTEVADTYGVIECEKSYGQLFGV